MLVLLDFLKKLVGLSFVFDIVRREAEREHILRTLKHTNWVVGGPGGAAVRLGMKRTTRNSLVKRLGITQEIITDQQSDIQLMQLWLKQNGAN